MSNANAALGAMVMFLATFSDGGFLKIRRTRDHMWSVTIHAPGRTEGVLPSALVFDADSLPIALNDACVKFFARLRFQASTARRNDHVNGHDRLAATKEPARDVERFLAELVTTAEGDDPDGDL